MESQRQKGGCGFSTKKWLPKATADVSHHPRSSPQPARLWDFPSHWDLRERFTRRFGVSNRLKLSSFKDNKANTKIKQESEIKRKTYFGNF